jgi:hypothetical protein
MPAQHDPLALLQTPVAQALLQSTIPARLAYTGRDGTPRVLPIWFHWTGEVFVLGTRLDSGKVKALSTYPTVALTIDTESFAYKALQVRGTIEIETIDGIVPEYELCAKRYLGEQRGQMWDCTASAGISPDGACGRETGMGGRTRFGATLPPSHRSGDGCGVGVRWGASLERN